VLIAGYRAAAEDPSNFGPAGVVMAQSITTTNLSSVTAATLAQLDGFVASFWADSDTTAAEATAVIDFFLAGGDLILLQDDSAHDAIGEQLGIPTSLSDGLASNGGTPLFEGPFGSASNVAQSDTTGQLSVTDVFSHGGGAGATNGSGQITAAYWNRGDYALGAGRLLIIADVDMWATTNATYAPLNDNGTFALNGTHFTLLPEPGALWQLGPGIGLLALLSGRRRRRTASHTDTGAPGPTRKGSRVFSAIRH
jgi:hypothetical protein